jgi:L-iditol 2-dehydrogenase
MCQNLLGIGGSAGNFGDCDRLFHKEGVGGCFATHLKAPQSCVIRLPEGMSMEAGSLMEPLADVVHSVDNAGVGPGDIVVIIGLGPMGLLHVVAAKYNGAETIVCVDIDAARLRTALELGATHVFNSGETDVVAKVREMTGGLGATKIFVTAGGKAQASCAGQAMEMVRKEGTVALFASADVTADELVVSINKIHYDMLHLTGTVGFSKEHGEKALALLASGIFNPMLIRNYELPLEKLDEAVRLYGKGAHLKIGLDLKGSVAKS